MPAAVGMRFGRYELVSKLGVGGMGEVFRARDHDLQRDVAIKFLPERFADDPIRLGRFSQESRAASSLNHPNIVTIHEIGETSGLPYIVMELVEGKTLRKMVRGGPLPARRTLDLAAQLADGLAKAHAAEIIHRDLKPENVMVTDDGFVKILDFGLAKLRASDSGDHDLWFDSDHPTWPESPTSPQTAAGVVLGTVGYMSPEQARGRPVDARSDQFSFGAIVYEMASGTQAFHRETPAQTLTAIIEASPEPLAALAPSLPPPARWIVERCLEKEPSDRYASTLDLAREMRNVRERLGEVASSGSSPAAAWATSRQRLWGVVAAGLAVLGLLVATSFVGPTLVERAAVFLELRAVPADKRLAVLPFRAIGGDDADRALAEGLADLLTVRLAQLERFQETLWVEPASNVRQAGVRSASGAGRALGVTLVISGTVQRTDDHLLLTAILEDTQRSRTLRAATARSAEGLAQAVVRMLELELGPEARAALRATGTGVAEAATLSAQAIAYTPYAMGRTALERYEESQALERAIGLFNQALERDPRYALAHAGLGEAYWRLYQNEKRAELAILAEEHCERALVLDDLLAPAWITLGLVRSGTGRAEDALEDFQRALDRDPRNPAAHRERGYALERLGRFEDAEATYRRAIELRPDYWSNYNYLGAFLASRGRADEAEAAFRQALERAPDNARAWRNLGAALYYQGRTTEAEAAWLRSMELRPSAAGASNLAALQFYEGRYSEAAETLREATRDGTRDYRIWRNLGSALYWAPGRRDEATAAYGRAVELAEEQRAIDPSDAHLLIELADSLAMLGEREKARSTAREALDMGPVDGHVAVTAAGLYEHLGDRESALRWVEAALRAGHPPDEIDADPGLEGVRSDPRYLDLTTRMSPPDRPHLEP